jgi:hypothetical protein
MKAMRIVGLGIVIWGLSLVWPEINLVLTPPAMIGLLLALGGAALGYLLSQRRDHRPNGDSTGQDHPTRPLPMALAR